MTFLWAIEFVRFWVSLFIDCNGVELKFEAESRGFVDGGNRCSSKGV